MERGWLASCELRTTQQHLTICIDLYGYYDVIPTSAGSGLWSHGYAWHAWRTRWTIHASSAGAKRLLPRWCAEVSISRPELRLDVMLTCVSAIHSLVVNLDTWYPMCHLSQETTLATSSAAAVSVPHSSQTLKIMLVFGLYSKICPYERKAASGESLPVSRTGSC